MKTLGLFLCLLGISFLSHSSHLVGGDLHYRHIQNDEYEIILKIYRDCENSATDFDNPVFVGIYNNGSLIQNVELYFSDAVFSDVPANANDPCLIPPSDICVKEAIYTKSINLPYFPGGYDMVYQRCCRSTALTNTQSNDDIGMTLTTYIPDHEIYGHNSNPDFLNFPPIAICLGSPFEYDHSAIDEDGDVLTYEFCNPLLGGSLGNIIPNPPSAPPYNDLVFDPGFSLDYPITSNPAFTIDPNTGLLSGTPTELGVYVVGVCIKEFRDGELINSTNRDFQFNVVLCGNTVLASTNGDDECDPDLIVEFSTTAAAAENYYWDFGDPNTDDDFSTEWSPAYEYSEPGIYTASVIVNEGLPCQDTAYVEVESYLPPENEFEIVDFYCEAGSVLFDFEVTSENAVDAAYYWFFGSGSEPSNYTGIDPPSISYDEPGEYLVTLTLVESPCQTIELFDLNVEPFPSASISPENDICQGLSIDFNNDSSGSLTYLWDFGDESTMDDTSELENPTYTYPEEGTYLVSLTVNQGSTCENTYFTEIEVNNDPSAEFEIESIICEDGSIFIDLSSPEGNEESTEYSWNFSEFAEPSLSDMENPGTIVYTEPGQFNISLIVTDGPCSSSFFEPLDVNEIPVALIDSQTEFCDGLTFDFVNNSQNGTSYFWEFGDGGFSSVENPSYTYNEYGTYLVSLSAITADCESLDQIEVQILPPDPIDFSFDLVTPPVCEETTGVTMIWTGEGADNVTWNVGSGISYEGFEATHMFDDVGTYVINVSANQELCEYSEFGSGTVEFEFFVLDAELKFPNVFTPNNDEFNKVFRMAYEDEESVLPEGRKMLDYISNYSMSIYNRWGNEVFNSEEGSSKFWDGKDANEGTYYFIIRYQRNCLDDDIQVVSSYFQLMR